MDAAYIKPFIASIQNVFSTMLQLQVTVQAPYLKAADSPTQDISGIIGMSGDVVGSVVLSFPTSAAENVVALFCGQRLTAGTPDFADAIGELVNMVCGGAKALFRDKKVSISCPSVVIGAGHTVARQSDVPCVVIPCATDCGTLNIEVSIKERAPAPGATAAAKA
jgi:chemotaxis protein CheX